MSDATPEQTTPAAEEPSRRKGPPLWGVVAFLALLGGAVVLQQLVSTSGPKIQWVEIGTEQDLATVLKRVSPAKPRVFLYLYELSDPIHARNEREVFVKRWARDPLVKVICCRAAVRKGDALATRYAYHGTPLFVLLNAEGRPTMGGRTEGGIGEKEFFTYIGKPIDDATRSAP